MAAHSGDLIKEDVWKLININASQKFELYSRLIDFDAV